MSPRLLFTDGSVNIKTNIGYGAYLMVENKDDVSALVKVKQFEDTSSTKLELQTLLWALEEVKGLGREMIIYTDSQNIIGLPKRRERFEKNDFLTTKKTLIAHHLLYKAFYKMMDELKCSLIKVKGHKLSSDKDEIDHLFTLVDRASREALRKSLYM